MKNLTHMLFLVLILTVLLPGAPAMAEETSVTIQGTVFHDGTGFVLTDGITEYLLQGVDDANLEGQTYEVSGLLNTDFDTPTIQVQELREIYPPLFREDDPAQQSFNPTQGY